MEQNKNTINQEAQVKKPNIIQKIKQNKALKAAIAVVAIVAIGGGIMYWKNSQSRIYIEKAEVSAPIIDLAAQNPGTLNDVMVSVGDTVGENSPVARVGDEIIKSKVGGLIVSTKNDSGKIFNRGESVVSMISPD